MVFRSCSGQEGDHPLDQPLLGRAERRGVYRNLFVPEEKERPPFPERQFSPRSEGYRKIAPSVLENDFGLGGVFIGNGHC